MKSLKHLPRFPLQIMVDLIKDNFHYVETTLNIQYSDGTQEYAVVLKIRKTQLERFYQKVFESSSQCSFSVYWDDLSATERINFIILSLENWRKRLVKNITRNLCIGLSTSVLTDFNA